MSWLTVEKSNLHFENCTAASRIEKELEAAWMQKKSLAGSVVQGRVDGGLDYDLWWKEREK